MTTMGQMRTMRMMGWDEDEDVNVGDEDYNVDDVDDVDEVDDDDVDEGDDVDKVNEDDDD